MRSLLTTLVCTLFVVSAAVAYPKSDYEGPKISESVELLLLAKNYDAIEKLADEYRKSNRKIRGGNSALYHFYPGLSYSGESDVFSSSASSQQKRALLEEWSTRYPKSITAKIALALYWSKSGWDARGGHFAKYVTEQQWKIFRENLAIARKTLNGVDPSTDPYVYLLLSSIAKGMSAPRTEMDELYNRSVKAFPDFFHYYADRAVSLLERWYGEPGEVAGLAVSTLEKMPGGKNGTIAYTYITMQLLVHDQNKIFHELGLKWEPIEAGYQAREKQFGLRTRDWNAWCYLAALAGHPHEAKSALEHIGDDWDPALWRSRNNFDAVKKWINSRTTNPQSRETK